MDGKLELICCSVEGEGTFKIWNKSKFPYPILSAKLTISATFNDLQHPHVWISKSSHLANHLPREILWLFAWFVTLALLYSIKWSWHYLLGFSSWLFASICWNEGKLDGCQCWARRTQRLGAKETKRAVGTEKLWRKCQGKDHVYVS